MEGLRPTETLLVNNGHVELICSLVLINSNQGNELEQHGHILLQQGNKFLISTLCVGLSWTPNKCCFGPILFKMTSHQLIFDFSWSTSGPLSRLRSESERSCSSGSKQGVFTLHLRSWLFIYGLHCESFNWNFPPKELPTCERKTEIMCVVSGYGLGWCVTLATQRLKAKLNYLNLRLKQ